MQSFDRIREKTCKKVNIFAKILEFKIQNANLKYFGAKKSNVKQISLRRFLNNFPF